MDVYYKCVCLYCIFATKSYMKSSFLNDVIQWDAKTWSDAILFWEKNMNWTGIQTALELGGREGGLSLWLATKGIHVVCSDLENSKATAEPLHQKYKIIENIEYEDISALSIGYENHFDVIVFKSIIGGIGRCNCIEKQEIAFQGIYKALKPGGFLLFAENLVASPLHQYVRRRFVKWGSQWRYVSIDEMKHFMVDFSHVSIATTGVLAAFGRSERQRRFLSFFDKILLNKITPAKWKYVVFGIARK